MDSIKYEFRVTWEGKDRYGNDWPERLGFDDFIDAYYYWLSVANKKGKIEVFVYGTIDLDFALSGCRVCPAFHTEDYYESSCLATTYDNLNGFPFKNLCQRGREMVELKGSDSPGS